MGNRREQTKELFGDTFNADGTLRAVSATQTITFKRCGMRWHFEKKGRLQKKPMGKGAAQGQRSHDLMEKFLETGQDVRGPLELIGAGMIEPYLWAAPFNKGPGLVEGPLLQPRMQTPGGILITGYFDYYIPGMTGHDGTGFEWPVIIDHKFKKDLEKWAPDEEELATDPQAIMYMAWALERQTAPDGVIFRHHNVQTEGEGGRYPLPVEIRLTRAQVLAKWNALAGDIDGPMVEAAKIPAAGPGLTPDGVPFNDMACGDFGGCDFAATCRHSPMNKFSNALRGGAFATRSTATIQPASLEQNPMSLIAQAIAAKNPPAAATAAPAEDLEALLAASIAAKNAPAAKPDVLVKVPTAEAVSGTLYLIPGGSPAKFEGMVGNRAVFRTKSGGLQAIDATADIYATDAETLALFTGTTPAAPALSPAKEEKARKLGIVDKTTTPDKVAATAPPDAAPTPTAPSAEVTAQVSTGEAIATTPPADPVTPVPAPAKRGRPTKAEAEAKALTLGTAPAPLDLGTKEAPILMLLINASCNRAQDLAPYVKGLCDEVAQRFGAPDVRLGKKETDLSFGGWKGCLAMAAAKNPPTGLCSITSGELADPVIEALIPLASIVVRGSR